MGVTAKHFYVYILRRPSGEPFYVGMGRGNRARKHERIARRGDDSHKSRVIRRILESGGAVGVEIVARYTTAVEAQTEEKRLVRLFGRADMGAGPLVNHTDGGDGVVGWSAEMRQAQSERGTRTMANPANKDRLLKLHRGRQQGADEIEKRAASLRGKVHDPARVEARAAACRGRKRAPELVAAHAAMIRGRKHSLETLAAMSAYMNRRYADPAARTEQSARMRAVLADPILRAKLSAAHKGRKHSDATRAKIAAGVSAARRRTSIQP